MGRSLRASLVMTTVGLLAGCSHAAAPSVASGPAEMPVVTGYRELTADQQVLHAVSRLTFGAKPGEIDRVRAMGVDRWIDQQLHPERIPDAATESFFASYETYHATAAELERKYPRPQTVLAQLGKQGDRQNYSAADSARLRQLQQAQRRMVTELQSGRVARALVSDRELQEVMTDFWLNHFSVYMQKAPPEHYLIAHYENEVIRPNALGKFRTLLGAVAKSPAMLFYLDNWQSQVDSNRPRLNAQGRYMPSFTPQQAQRLLAQRQRAGQPMPPGVNPGNVQQLVAAQRKRGLNENYGRELLELHTLGVDGGYTQADVIAAAQALTGWTLQAPPAGDFVFRPQVHDAGEKVFLGHKFPAGRGIEEGEEVLDIVARHPATARYIATKLVRRFVSDTPPGALVDRAAATFTATDGDIREVMRTIVTSPEFFARATYRAKVKSPFEVIVSALRALGASPDSTPRTAAMVALLGQPIYGHMAPNGWPETGDQWMNTGAILNRINFGIAVAANRLPGASVMAWPGADALRNAPLDQQVEGVVHAFLGGDVSRETRAILTSGENPMARLATNEPMPAMTPPPPPMPGDGPPDPATAAQRLLMRLPPLKGLPQIVGLAIGSPEFQRR